MRDFKGMKRQRGRNRGGGGQGGKPQHNANRAFDSNGPEGVKVRGAAQSVFEKYQQLARDAASSGDRILAENYLQHAEHYFRTLRAMQPHRPVADIVGREQFASGFDIDFEAEPEELPEAPAAEAEAAEGGEGGEGGQPREGQRFEGRRDRDRDGQRFEGRRDRDDRPREDRQRDDRPRDERPREDRPREEREGGGRRDRWRDREDRRDRGERNTNAERSGESPRDPLAVVEPQAAAPLAEPHSGESPRLRGQDGAVSELPAFLGRSATPPAAEETPAVEVKKPRRRRAPRSFEGGEAPAETEEA
ncbi:hypothetical protein CSW64_05030 [Caulobacter mirabilis]|uniref:DUF4167 domain-containing protein n=2 Tax=Caulobacter mirabilis TaxID=69666 RepID=A0A2D2AUZ2_9CAUL|nr:DUF4167 domain-containing protein [Caulobacter mirabilis]ATQ41820.1 hypothetical protein CSW64_05030 [Caulobacter mirabilis]